MSTVLFLDLEETVIDDWSTRCLLLRELNHIANAIQVRNARKENPIVSLGLFSFAVDDDRDLTVFKEELQKPIERVLGLEFDLSLCLTIERIKHLFTKATGVFLKEPGDVRDIIGDKAFTFFRTVPLILPKDVTQAFLIDDMVQDMDLRMVERGLVLSTRTIVPNISVVETEGKIRFVQSREPALLGV